MTKVAVVFDHLARPDTTGTYCLRALAELAETEHFHPSRMAEIPRDGYDLYLSIDDGFSYKLPQDLRPQAYWAIDTHIDFECECERAAGADFVFAAQKLGAAQLSRRLGREVEWLPLACDPLIHARHDVATVYNVSFVGNLLGHERLRLIQLLQSEILNFHVGRHFFEEMAAVYSASRIVFNRSVVDDINMRVFEGLCSGSLLITNDLTEKGQEELFQDSKHLVTYASDEELLDKVRFYLSHDAAREKIAALGRQEVIEKHTYTHRMARILERISRRKAAMGSDPPSGIPLGPDPYNSALSVTEILSFVPQSARTILDLGCGAGQLGRALKARQACTVYGVEINDAASKKAGAHLDRVWTADIESFEPDLPEGSLDVIVCGDVLEHLREPRGVLQRLSRYLRADGQLIASIPNVGHHTVLRGLLTGQWCYEPAGILDETHFRFFTAIEIEKLFFRAGFRIERLDAVRSVGDESLLIDAEAGRVDLGSISIRDLPPEGVEGLTAYQYLVMASKQPRASKHLTSIVILTHNQLEYTKLCLASIRSRTDEPYEVIVVDNGSTDGTVEYLREIQGLHLITNPENRGFPAAVNQGIKAAKGDTILLLNNDCIVTTGWLRRLLDALDSEPNIGLVGPYSNCVSGDQQIAVDYRLLNDLDGFAWKWSKAHAGQRLETDRLVGFCLLVTRTLVDRIGLLDERFGLGNYEDDDYCRRARDAGFKAVIAEDVFVHHFGSVTYRANGVDFASLLMQNRQLFEEKWDSHSGERGVPRESVLPAPNETISSNQPIAPVPTSRTKLSLCMIVRDSARTLGACLASIRPWIDELIVVDTGSRDDTESIALRFGAKLFHFPWCDDFSAARNESLSHATGEWIFWLDSDDTIDEANGRKLRMLVDGDHRPNMIAYVAQVHCPHEVGSLDYTAVDHVKLFRNLPELRFEGKIHEQILPAINRMHGAIAWTDIFVVHSGSDHSVEGQAKKLERDLRILTAEAAERPDHPFVLFNLGMTCLEMKRYEAAANHLTRTIEVAEPHESHVPKAYSLLVQALSDLGRVETAVVKCREGLDRYPDDPELIFRAGVLAQQLGKPQEAENYYRILLGRSFEPRFRSIDVGILSYKTRQNLAALYAEERRHAEAEEQWLQVLQERPMHEVAWRGLIDALLQQSKTQEARNRVYGSPDLHHSPETRAELHAYLEEVTGDLAAARQILERAISDSPNHLGLRDSLCKLIFERGDPREAESALEEFAERFPTNAAALNNLAVTRLRNHKYELAARSFEKSLELRPNWPPAYSHLAQCYERLGNYEKAAATRSRFEANCGIAKVGL